MIIEGWNKRLKEARKKNKISLTEAEEKLGISEQSIIKYEKGEFMPKIDTLDKMCACYHVSVSWVLYGDDDYSSITREANYLYLLFSLMHSGKMVPFNNEKEMNNLYAINDQKLLRQMKKLYIYKNNVPLSGKEDYEKLIEGIEKIFYENVDE